MQAFVERARQALGVGGGEAFLPSTLEAQENTLNELNILAPNLKTLVKATQQFSEDTRGFLDAGSTFVTSAPFPRLWMQGSAIEAATPAQTPVPAEHAAWFDASAVEREAAVVPGAVSYALQHELLAPMEQWLWAHQVAQGYFAELQSKRLEYDAERRKLVARATAATSAAAAKAAAAQQQQQPQEHVVGGMSNAAVEDPAMAQLAEEAAAINSVLSEFESDAEALDDLLHWLVEGAVRLKALLADAAGAVGVAADSWGPPPGLMPPFPEKSAFGESLEVTVTTSDSPRLGGLGGTHTAEHVVASPTTPTAPTASATTAAPTAGEQHSATITSFHPKHTKGHTAAAAAAGGGSSGGGSEGSSAQHLDLSSMLPSDDAMVFAGGAPPASSTSHAPPGGGAGQLLKDSLLQVGTSQAAEPGAAAAEGGDAGIGEGEGAATTTSAATTAAAAAGGGPEKAQAESEAVTQVEEEKSSSSSIWASIQRTVAEAGATAAAAAASVAAAVPGLGHHRGDKGDDWADASSSDGGIDDSNGSSTTAERQSVSSHKLEAFGSFVSEHDAGGGAEGGEGGATESGATDSAAAAGGGGDVEAAVTALPPAAAEAVLVEGPARPGDAAAGAEGAAEGGEGHDSAVLGPAAGAASGGAVGGAAGINERTEAAPTMHIGPVAPESGPSEPAPGSAVWVKEATPPGGAAAAAGAAATGEGAGAVEDAAMPEQGQMHIGPVAPASGRNTPPAPGSAVWVKDEATPPGGAAAAAAPAGSEEGVDTRNTAGSSSPFQAAASDTTAATAGGVGNSSSGSSSGGVSGPEGAKAAEGGGPDLSKILPAYEHGVPEPHSKPEGGTFATFIKDTLLGPSSPPGGGAGGKE